MKFKALEKDGVWRSCRLSRLQCVPNESIKEKINTKEDVTDRVENQIVMWYGHFKRMREIVRSLLKIWNWRLMENEWEEEGQGERGDKAVSRGLHFW